MSSTWDEVLRKRQVILQQQEQRLSEITRQREVERSKAQSSYIEARNNKFEVDDFVSRKMKSDQVQATKRQAALDVVEDKKSTTQKAKDWLGSSDASKDIEQGKAPLYEDTRNKGQKALDTAQNMIGGVLSGATLGISDALGEAAVNFLPEDQQEEIRRGKATEEYYKTGSQKAAETAGIAAGAIFGLGKALKAAKWGGSLLKGALNKGAAKTAEQVGKMPKLAQYAIKGGAGAVGASEVYGTYKGISGEAPENVGGPARIGAELGYAGRVGLGYLGQATAGVGKGMQIEADGGFKESVGEGLESAGTSLQNKMLSGLNVEEDFTYDYANDESFSAVDLLNPSFYSRVVAPQLPTTLAMMAQAAAVNFVGKKVATAGGAKVLGKLGKGQDIGKDPWWGQLFGAAGAGYLGRVVESKMEGSQVYDQVLAAGGSGEQATAAYNEHYDRLMKALVSTDSLQTLLMFGVMSGNQRKLFKNITGRQITRTEEALLRTAGIVATEGGEESFQQMSSEVAFDNAMGNPTENMWGKWAEFVSGNASPEAYEAGAVGSMMGIAMSGASLYTTATQKKTIDSLSDPQKTQLREYIRAEQANNPEASEMELNEKVLNYLGEKHPNEVQAAAQEVNAQVEQAKLEDEVDIAEGMLVTAMQLEAPRAAISEVAATLYQTYDQNPERIVDLVIGLQDRGNVSDEVGRIFTNELEKLFTAEGYVANGAGEQTQAFDAIPSIFEKPSQLAQHNKFVYQYERAVNSEDGETKNVNNIVGSFLKKNGLEEVGNQLGALGMKVVENESHAKIQKAIADTFGHKVVFFEAHPFLQENGITPSGAYSNGTIYVNANTKNPVAHIIGHELGHAMHTDQTFDKTAYNELFKAMGEAGIASQELRDYVGSNDEKANSELLAELVNDALGDALNSDTFWQSLYKNSPKVFQQVYNALKKIASQLTDFFGKTEEEFDTRLNFQNADEMVAKAEKVLQQYSQHQQRKAHGKVLVKSRREKIDGVNRETFGIYDTTTGQTVWESNEYGAAGRKAAVAMKARIESGEFVYNDINKKQDVEPQPVKEKQVKQQKKKKTQKPKPEPKQEPKLEPKQESKLESSSPGSPRTENEKLLIDDFEALGFKFEDGEVATPVEQDPEIAQALQDIDDLLNFQSSRSLAKKAALIPIDNAFKAWFKNSKVVNGRGKPLILYHGTSAEVDFESFNTTTEEELGSHFGTKKAASEFAGDMGSRMIPVYLSIQNPLEAPDVFGTAEKALHWLRNESGLPKSILLEEARALLKDSQNMYPGGSAAQETEFTQTRKNAIIMMKTYLKKLGYDGIKYVNVYEDKGSTSWIAFDPSQIKSVYNEGTWSPGDPRMMKKAGGSESNVRENEYWRESALLKRETKGINGEGVTEAERRRYIRVLQQKHTRAGSEFSEADFEYRPEVLKLSVFSDIVKICDILGVRIIPYKVNFTGDGVVAYDGFTDKEGELYVNIDGTTSPGSVVWHEAGHIIERIFPSTYNRIKKSVLKRLSDTNPEGLKNVKDYYQAEYPGEYLRGEILEEFISDLLAQAHSQSEPFFDVETLEQFLNGYIEEILNKIKIELDSIDPATAKRRYAEYKAKAGKKPQTAKEIKKQEDAEDSYKRSMSLIKNVLDPFVEENGLDYSSTYQILDTDGNIIYEVFKITERDADGFGIEFEFPKTKSQFEAVSDALDNFIQYYSDLYEHGGKRKKVKLVSEKEAATSEISSIKEILLDAAQKFVAENHEYKVENGEIVEKSNGKVFFSLMLSETNTDIKAWQHNLNAFDKQVESFRARREKQRKADEDARKKEEEERLKQEREAAEERRKQQEADKLEEFRVKAKEAIQKIDEKQAKKISKAKDMNEIKSILLDVSRVQKQKMEDTSDSSQGFFDGSKAKAMLELANNMHKLEQEQLRRVANILDRAGKAIEEGRRIHPRVEEAIGELFNSYEGRINPIDMGDTALVKTLKYLGMDLSMGVEYFENPLYSGKNAPTVSQEERAKDMTGRYELRYYWRLTGNLKSYSNDLYSLGFRFEPETKSYTLSSKNIANSPLRNLIDRFGGEDYIREANRLRELKESGGEDKRRFMLTGLKYWVDGELHESKIYETKVKNKTKRLFSDKGLTPKENPSIKGTLKQTWFVLRQHQKEGVNLAIQSMDKIGAFLLADGTGSGKTMSMLAVAEYYAKRGKTVLILTQDEGVYQNAFLRDAATLEAEGGKSPFWKNRLHWLSAGMSREKIGKFEKDKVNVAAYNYLSIGNMSILEKLDMEEYPQVVLFDESHNLKNVVVNPDVINRGAEYKPEDLKNILAINKEIKKYEEKVKAAQKELKKLKDNNSKKKEVENQIKGFEAVLARANNQVAKIRQSNSVDGGSKVIQGYELSMNSEKCLFASATPYDKGEEILYMNKFGFLKNSGRSAMNFMSNILGYTYVSNEKNSRKPYWKAESVNWSNGQVSYLFDELIEAGAAIKREIDLDGVSVDFVKYKVPLKVARVLDKVQDLWEKRVGAGATPTAQIKMAQRRIIESQKVPQIFKMALNEIKEGRKVIIFAENVNTSDFSKTLINALLEDATLMASLRQEAIRMGVTTKAKQEAFIQELITRELELQGLNDLRGTLSYLNELFEEYFDSEYNKANKDQLTPKASKVAKIYGDGDVQKEIAKFQNGEALVALVTPGKGGVGVSLDDVTGDWPRTIIMATPTYGGISLTQAIGRAWRLTTESDLRVLFVSTETDVDNWSFGIVQRKLKTLGAAFNQRDVMLAGEAASKQADEALNEIDLEIDRSDYDAGEENVFQAGRKLNPEQIKLRERAQQIAQAKSRAQTSATTEEYVKNMSEASKLEVEELREKGLEDEAKVEEEVQASIEDDAESLTNIVETYPVMADTVSKEIEQEYGTVNITLEQVLAMREEQAKKDGDERRLELIKNLRGVVKKKGKNQVTKDAEEWENTEKGQHFKRTQENKNKKDEVVLTPAQVVGKDKGMGFAIREREAAKFFGVLTSEDCAPRSRLEKWLIGDNVINMMRLGQLNFRARTGREVSKKEYRKFITDSLRWKLMEGFIDDKVSIRFLEELAYGDVPSAEKSVYKLMRMYSGIATRTYRDLLARTTRLCELMMGDDGKYSADIEAAVQAKGVMEHIEEIKKFRLDKIGDKYAKESEESGEPIDQKGLQDEQSEFLKNFYDVNITPEIFESQYVSKLSASEKRKVDLALEEYRKIHREILDELFENGIVSKKTYQTLTEAYPKYIPMYRDISDRSAVDIDSSDLLKDVRTGAFAHSLYPLYSYRGSNLMVGNLIDNMIQYHARAKQSIDLNRIITTFDGIIDAFEGTQNENLFVKRHTNTSLIHDNAFVTEDGVELNKSQLNQLIELVEGSEEEESGIGIGQIIKSKSKKGSAFVVAQREGKSVLYEMHPVLIEAIRTMQKTDPRSKDHMVAKVVGDVLRTGATASPEFWIRNIVRDSSHGYTVSDSEMQFYGDMVKVAGFQLAGTNKEQYQELWDSYMLQGGGMGNVMNDIVARQIGFRNEALGMGNRYGKTNINNHPAFRVIDGSTVVPIRALQKAAATAETVSRFAEYVAAKRAGQSDEEAAFRAMDQQDYGMAGKYVRLLNEIIPFFNAPIQSKYKIIRAAEKNPMGVLFKSVMTITLPTMFALAMRALDDDEDRQRAIAEASDYVKSNFWLIPVPGTNQIMRIAKPFDLSIIFANTLESFYEWAWRKDPITLKQSSGRFLKNSLTWGVVGNNYIPQVVNILTEWMTGYNIFYGSSVVPVGEQDEANEMQFDSDSYHLTIGIARMFSAIGLDYAPLTSPRRIDSMVNTTFASLGTLVLDTTDMIWDTVSYLAGHETYRERIKGQRAHGDSKFAQITNRDMTEFPVLRSFLVKDDYGKSVNEFYREHERLQKKYKQYKYYMELGEADLAAKSMNQEDLYKYAVFDEAFDAYESMKASNSAYRSIRDNKYLTGEQKNAWMRQISKSRNRLAREVMLWSKMYDAGIPQMLQGTYDLYERQEGLFADSESYTERYNMIIDMSGDLKPKMKQISAEIKKLNESVNQQQR